MPTIKTKDEVRIDVDGAGEVIGTYREFVNKDTGEIKYLLTTKYYTMSFDTISYISRLVTGMVLKVFIELCLIVQYEKNTISLTKRLKLDISERCNLKFSSVNKAIYELKRYGILIIEDDILTLSPFYAWRGSINSRDKFIYDNIYKFKLDTNMQKYIKTNIK